MMMTVCDQAHNRTVKHSHLCGNDVPHETKPGWACLTGGRFCGWITGLRRGPCEEVKDMNDKTICSHANVCRDSNCTIKKPHPRVGGCAGAKVCMSLDNGILRCCVEPGQEIPAGMPKDTPWDWFKAQGAVAQGSSPLAQGLSEQALGTPELMICSQNVSCRLKNAGLYCPGQQPHQWNGDCETATWCGNFGEVVQCVHVPVGTTAATRPVAPQEHPDWMYGDGLYCEGYDPAIPGCLACTTHKLGHEQAWSCTTEAAECAQRQGGVNVGKRWLCRPRIPKPQTATEPQFDPPALSVKRMLVCSACTDPVHCLVEHGCSHGTPHEVVKHHCDSIPVDPCPEGHRNVRCEWRDIPA